MSSAVTTLLHTLTVEGFFYGPLPAPSDADLLTFCEGFGVPSSEPRDGILVKTIMPTERSEAAKNTLSSRHGVGVFPFHTDTAYWREPARWLVLLCDEPGSARRQTILSDKRVWRLTEGEQRTLANEVWMVRGVGSPFLCTHSNPRWLRADEACMFPAVEGLDASRRIVEDHVRQSPHVHIDWQHAWVLVIDNWRMLHARGAANQPDPDRRLRRVLVRST